jgi:DNA replication and repair protein RecF
MFLSHLSLTHFRNYARLELDFTKPLTLMQGRNAQGKTNLLEAVYFLATSKPVHATTEREVVGWQAADEPIPYCRVAVTVRDHPEMGARPLELEILLTPRGDGVNFKKQVKINGAPKRSLDLVGLMRAVLFLPEDIKLVDGSPGERRRYLDIALCQIDRTYCRELAAFQKVLTQRNSLLKTLREQNAAPNAPTTAAQLGFWDEQMVQHGSYVVWRRDAFLHTLQECAALRHRALTSDQEELVLQYVPSFNVGSLADAEFERLREGTLSATPISDAPLTHAQVTERYAAKLASRRGRELAAGNSLYGPHRDDLRFLANGHDLRVYGSRGQQRTAALSLKLAEVTAMTEATGTPPLLLLDDVMSELDAVRRSTLLAALDGVEQALLTTTDWDDFTPEFRAQAQLLTIRQGEAVPA